MKMPTKDELLRLQQQYHTDKRIAEVLGGNVTEHLVRYWRRKKGIPRRSFPKYSEDQIRELWERLGDDFRCGREIGLSKAGFYSWRRKYGIKEKPTALKLEQLELRFGAEPKMGRNGVFIEYYRTAAEKILAKCSGLESVERGQLIEVTPDLIILAESDMSRDKFQPSNPVADRVRFVTGVTMCQPHKSDGKMESIESAYSLLYRNGPMPNLLIIQNGCAAGGLSAFSALTFEVDESQMEQALKTGSLSILVPPIMRITLQGRLQRGVTAFDIFGYTTSNLATEVFENSIVEYSGNVIEKLNMYDRVSLCHLTPASGAVCGYTVFDETTRKFLAKHSRIDYKASFSDNKAYYVHDYVLTVSGLEPQAISAANPTSGRRVEDLTDVKPISLVFIGGPCGGSVEALKQVAEVLKGRKINQTTKLFVSPIAHDTYVEAMKRRILIPIAEAGGTILPGGCCVDDIPGFDPNSTETILVTPDKFDDSCPPNCWFVSHLTAAESAVNGKLATWK